MSFKRCKDCGEVKPFDEFYNDKRYKDGKYPYCKSCKNARSVVWQKANPEKRAANKRRTHLKRTYGITPEQFDEMYEAQGGKCFICGTDEPGGRHGMLNVDHCHDSGDVRALLCDGCNRGLGHFKEDPDALISAAMYILAHKEVDDERKLDAA